MMYRFEDERLLRGAGHFVENMDLTGCLHAVFVRSPHAHARIEGIDAADALALQGVRGIYTCKDFVAAGVKPTRCVRALDSTDGTPFFEPVRHVLARDTVRFVGDPVAMVVADSARRGDSRPSEQVAVDYDAFAGGSRPGGQRPGGGGAPGRRCGRRGRGHAEGRPRGAGDASRTTGSPPCRWRPVRPLAVTMRPAIATGWTPRPRECTSCAP